ncbi:MAG: hypothetical protein C4344_07905, partial [Acidimicrobiia bacterium]
MRIDRLAYLVGWDPKGWPHHDPLQGVPYFLQQALLALAEAEGLQLEWAEGELRTARAPDYADALGLWPAEAYSRFSPLDPMAPERQGAFGRLLLPFLERALPEPEPLETIGPSPEQWHLGGAPVEVKALEVLQALPRWAQKLAHRQGLDIRRGGPAWGRWLVLGPVALRLWSAAWLARLGTEGPGELRVRVRGDQPLPVLALLDSLELLAAVRQLPELTDVSDNLAMNGRALNLDIDRNAASRLGVPVQTIDDTLYDAYGQRQISTIFTQLNQYRVVMEVAPQYRNRADLMNMLTVRSNGVSGALTGSNATSLGMTKSANSSTATGIGQSNTGIPIAGGNTVPLSTLASATVTNAPLVVAHQDQLPAVIISFNVAPGYSLSQAVDAINR